MDKGKRHDCVAELLDKTDDWRIERTPDGAVIIIKGPRAEALSSWVKASLQLGEEVRDG